MQTSLVRENEVVALNRFFYLESVWACCYDNQSGHSSYSMFSTVLLLSLLLSFLVSLISQPCELILSFLSFSI